MSGYDERLCQEIIKVGKEVIKKNGKDIKFINREVQAYEEKELRRKYHA